MASISFGSNPAIDYNWLQHTTEAGLKNAIKGLQFTGGGTNTADALTTARNMFENKPLPYSYGARPKSEGIPRVAIVLTDGISNNRDATKHQAEKLRASNVNVFAIGLGSHFKRRRARQRGGGMGPGLTGPKGPGGGSGTSSSGAAEIANIGSDPKVDHVYALKDIASIETIVDKMAQVTCNEPAALDSGDTVNAEIECGDTSYFKPVCKVLTKKMVVDVRDLKCSSAGESACRRHRTANST